MNIKRIYVLDLIFCINKILKYCAEKSCYKFKQNIKTIFSPITKLLHYWSFKNGFCKLIKYFQILCCWQLINEYKLDEELLNTFE